MPVDPVPNPPPPTPKGLRANFKKLVKWLKNIIGLK